jgi:hypothetical protein
MGKEHSLEELRMKAHSINCELYEDGFTPRDIEIIGYYLNRIASSYLSFFTHKDYEKKIKDDVPAEDAGEKYQHL